MLAFDIVKQMSHLSIIPLDQYHLRQLSPINLSNSAHANFAQNLGYFGEIYLRWINAEALVVQLKDERKATHQLQTTIDNL